MPAERVYLDRLRPVIEERFHTLDVWAERFLASGLLGGPQDVEVALLPEALLASVEAYYLLTSAYKALRTDPESPTQPPKIAAISALVFEEFKPLRIIAPERPVMHEMTPHANRLFALYWSSIVFEEDFARLFERPRSKDTLVRYFRVLRATRLTSLTGFRLDVGRGELADHYDILIDPDVDEHSITVVGKPSPGSDMPVIDTMILIFELLWQGGGDTRAAPA